MITDIVAVARLWQALLRPVALLAITAFATASAPARWSERSAIGDVSMVLGTWTGSSTCVGYRPSCKNEEVVYRFVEANGKPGLVTLLADKIIDGKRVPMYKLDFQYADVDHSLTCEFRRGQTHGAWTYTVSGDKMAGTLVIRPDKELGRRVMVHRVKEDQVPKAPGLDEYGSVEASHWYLRERANLAVNGQGVHRV